MRQIRLGKTIQEEGNKKKKEKKKKDEKKKEEEVDIPQHLEEWFARCSLNLQEEQKKHFAKMLHEFQNVFAKNSNEVGKCDVSQQTRLILGIFPLLNKCREDGLYIVIKKLKTR